MNKAEYSQFERDVAEFFEREGITNLSACGGAVCCECGGAVCEHCHRCKNCGEPIPEDGHEPFFSWSPCDCCGGPAGDREYAAGYHPEAKAVYVYHVCPDCLYYAEHGVFDDMTMDKIDG